MIWQQAPQTPLTGGAVNELEPLVGVVAACRLTKKSRATLHRQRNAKPPVQGPRRPITRPSSLAELKRDQVLGGLLGEMARVPMAAAALPDDATAIQALARAATGVAQDATHAAAEVQADVADAAAEVQRDVSSALRRNGLPLLG